MMKRIRRSEGKLFIGGMLMYCPRCKGTRIWRKGRNPTLKGARLRLVCFECGTTFYPEAIWALTKAAKATAAKSPDPVKRRKEPKPATESSPEAA